MQTKRQVRKITKENPRKVESVKRRRPGEPQGGTVNACAWGSSKKINRGPPTARFQSYFLLNKTKLKAERVYKMNTPKSNSLGLVFDQATIPPQNHPAHPKPKPNPPRHYTLTKVRTPAPRPTPCNTPPHTTTPHAPLELAEIDPRKKNGEKETTFGAPKRKNRFL